MTDLASDLTPRAFGHIDATRAAEAVPHGDHTLYTREARRAGRLVLTLRCSRRGERFVVDCETHNVAAAAETEPRRRAFAFRDRAAAERFSLETLRALEYLGCQVV